MKILALVANGVRNLAPLTLVPRARFNVFVGDNGQGKTNLLEAAGFLTALRSFRTTDNRLLITRGETVAAIACELEHERFGETRVTIRVRPDGKELWCDQQRIVRLADYLGKFPTVVFSSQDLQLVRGAPAGRRRWLDLTLAAMDAIYLRTLQTYTRALAERNSLLKRGSASEPELAAFEGVLAPAAADLIAARAAGVQALAATVQTAYAQLCEATETAELTYEPDFALPSAEALLARLESGRGRDLQFRTTVAGPHRDDFRLSVRGAAAKDFASEGQQRSLVLALRLAQAAWFRERSGVRPVLLADDVLGELDATRRRRFWSAIDPESQVIATGTRLPEGEPEAWQVFAVADGTFSENAPGMDLKHSP
jgi:DNA replication and repair protein RecF